jgi:WhiB family redox-sensing transcriptional regulator
MYNDEDPWWSHANCKGAAPKSRDEEDIFYPPRDKEQYRIIAAKAKQYCFGENKKNHCPVRKECLLDAVTRDEPHGIWGGLSHRERNALIRKWQKSYRKKMTLEEFILSKD